VAEGLDINLRADLEKEPPDVRTPMQKRWEWVSEVVRSWGPAILIVLVIRSILVEPFQIPSGSMVPTLAIGDFIAVSKFTYGLRVPFTDIEVVPLGEPERGDVVVFIYPPSHTDDSLCSLKRFPRWASGGRLPGPDTCPVDYIKRIVGLPGDVVEVRDNVVFVNGQEQTRVRAGSYPYVDSNRKCLTDDMHMFEESLGAKAHPVLQSASFSVRRQDYGPVTVPAGEFFMMGDNRDNSADSRIWGFVPRDYIRGKAMFVWMSFDICAGNMFGLGKVRWDRIGEGIE
jgi:signal peptidase I